MAVLRGERKDEADERERESTGDVQGLRVARGLTENVLRTDFDLQRRRE